MASWLFKDFVESSNLGGRANVILEWTLSLPPAAQAKIDAIILTLQGWDGPWPPQYVSARKDCPGILELRIGCKGVQYRPLGFHGPERGQFTLLIGAIEKGGKLEPREACSVAQSRRAIASADTKRTINHAFSADSDQSEDGN